VGQFDERLANLKLQPSIERLHQEASRSWVQARAEVEKLGNHARFYAAFVEFHIKAITKHLDDIDRVYRDVWTSDGNAVTPEFIRTLLVPRISMVISVRKGSITHEICRRRAIDSDISRGNHILATEISRLLGRIANRYEVEAIELGKQRARAAARTIQVAIARPTEASENKVVSRFDAPNSQADLWRGFHKGFQELADEEKAQASARPARFISAYFTYRKRPEILHVNGPGWLAQTLFRNHEIDGARMHLHEIPSHGPFCFLDMPDHGLWMLAEGVSETQFERFQTLAARSAFALGCPPKTDSVDFWLHHLLVDLRDNRSRLTFADDGETGQILRVCEASAIFCLRRERNQLESVSNEPAPGPVKPQNRLRSTVNSPLAARKMEAYLESKAIGLTEFATRVGTTDRTLRAFRRTGRVRRDIFESIAKQMGTTKEELLKHK
jgi:hypothetical protein